MKTHHFTTLKKTFPVVLLMAIAIVLLPTPAYAKGAKKKTIDVIVFAGQSNMMGHGTASGAPRVKKKTGYAYLPVTAPGKVSVFSEPFGNQENDKDINNISGEENYATGSMVAAFIKAYYKKTKTPVLAVPCAMIGIGSYNWADVRYQAIINRTNKAVSAAKKSGYKVGHIYLVWMQGESDALSMQRDVDGSCDSPMSAEEYIKNVRKMFKPVKKRTGIKTCFVIKIPSYYGSQKDPYGEKWSNYYKIIQNAQDTLCIDYSEFVMAYAKTPKLKASYLQKDGMHLTQAGLNKVGTGAGSFIGNYSLTDL